MRCTCGRTVTEGGKCHTCLQLEKLMPDLRALESMQANADITYTELAAEATAYERGAAVLRDAAAKRRAERLSAFAQRVLPVEIAGGPVLPQRDDYEGMVARLNYWKLSSYLWAQVIVELARIWCARTAGVAIDPAADVAEAVEAAETEFTIMLSSPFAASGVDKEAVEAMTKAMKTQLRKAAITGITSVIKRELDAAERVWYTQEADGKSVRQRG